MKKDKDQSQRFKDTARALGADETGASFERAFKKMVPPKKGQRSKRAKNRS